MKTQKKFRLSLLSLGVLALCFLLAPILYFHWHSSEAPTLSVIAGAVKLTDDSRTFVEIEPGILMFRASDIVFQEQSRLLVLPCNSYFNSEGWVYTDQMGAMLRYERKEQALTLLYVTCSSNYGLALLNEDPVTGQAITHKRPFNLFGL